MPQITVRRLCSRTGILLRHIAGLDVVWTARSLFGTVQPIEERIATGYAHPSIAFSNSEFRVESKSPQKKDSFRGFKNE